MHKAIRYPDFESESVLSHDPWDFVELWLKRKKMAKSLSYWLQARRFSDSAKTACVESAPLPLYYSFLNATKALLTVRAESHGAKHGVSGDRPATAKAYLSNEKVTFQSGGVLAALCTYLKDSSVRQEFSLKDLLWNIPFVHRAFQHTFTSSPELFIPVERACYVSRRDTRESWFEAEVVRRYADRRILKSVPSSLEVFDVDEKSYVRRKKGFRWLKGRASKSQQSAALKRLASYHSTTRRVVIPITGNRDLWYIKKNLDNNPLSDRHLLTLIFAVTHRLSELSRYDPSGFDRHLCGSANWLLTEFIEHAQSQFIDQIASEITGLQFWQPKMRS